MAYGKRIKYFRKRNRLSATALGRFLGFKEDNAEVRISQYETEMRKPRKKLKEKIAEALGVVPRAIFVPDIDSHEGLMHTFFAIEDMYGLTILTNYGRPCLCQIAAEKLDEDLCKCLGEWCDVKMDLLHGRISKTQYDDWRYNYPRIERKVEDHDVKYTPLADLLD